jgi:hypothetical protein
VTRIFVAVDLMIDRVADISTDAKQEVIALCEGTAVPTMRGETAAR